MELQRMLSMPGIQSFRLSLIQVCSQPWTPYSDQESHAAHGNPCAVDPATSARGRQDAEAEEPVRRLQRMTSSAAQQYDDRPAMARGGMGPDPDAPSEQPPEAEASGTLAPLHALPCAHATKCAGVLRLHAARCLGCIFGSRV